MRNRISSEGEQEFKGIYPTEKWRQIRVMGHWNSEIGDLAVNALSKILEIPLIITQENSIISIMNKGRDETPIIIHKIHNHYEAVSYDERHKTLWKDIYKTMEERNISWIDKEHIPV